jgi:hypothetical protein
VGYLDRLESATATGTLFTFQRVHLTGNSGWERRNATYTIANSPYGSSPFLATGAPAQPRKWRWSARFFTSRTHLSNDATLDLLNRAMDLGRQVRLVYIHDDGYERICDAIGYLLDAPIDSITDGIVSDLTVEWELLSPWHERAPVNPDRHLGAGLRLGQTGFRLGGSATVAITGTTFAIPSTMCDASVAGPGGIPTASDTGAVIKMTGPFGGDGGFAIQSFSGLPSVVNVGLKLLVGDALRLDFGAKDYLLTRAGAITDVSQFITTSVGLGYDFAVQAGVQNSIALFSFGGNQTSGGSIVIVWNRLFN